MNMRNPVKKVALGLIEKMPEDASLEDLMYELYFRQRVDRGLRELDKNKAVSHENVKRSVSRWLRTAGR